MTSRFWAVLLAWAVAVEAAPPRVAILPPADVTTALDAVREQCRELELTCDELTPPQLIEAAAFTAERYPVAVLAGSERFVHTVREDGDGARAVQRYLAEGGTLVVGGHVWPLFRPVVWNGADFEPLNRPVDAAVVLDPDLRRAVEARHGDLTGVFNLALGLFVAEAGGVTFETPPEPVKLTPAAGQSYVADWAEDLGWPTEGEQRYRSLGEQDLPPVLRVTPLARLTGTRDYGAGAAVVRFSGGPLARGTVVYAWSKLLDGALVRAVLRDVGARQRTTPAPPLGSVAGVVGEVAAALRQRPDLVGGGYLRREADLLAAEERRARDLLAVGCDEAARVLDARLQAAARRLRARLAWAVDTP